MTKKTLRTIALVFKGLFMGLRGLVISSKYNWRLKGGPGKPAFDQNGKLLTTTTSKKTLSLSNCYGQRLANNFRDY